MLPQRFFSSRKMMMTTMNPIMRRFKTTTTAAPTHKKITLSPSITKALNNQIAIELEASQLYLTWAIWAEARGLPGIASFFYAHSEEERQHYLKVIKYVNKRGGGVILPSIQQQENPQFSNILQLFESFLQEEEKVTYHVNEVIHECIQNKDYITHDFLQWFATEQIQEEELCKDIIDRLKLLNHDQGGMYTFDRDIMNFRKEN